MRKTLIVIQGPTGIGKTKLSIGLANYFNTEIISSDSRQLFKELSIGTAVPSADELNQVPHHFIHSHSIHENYNASRFESEAIKLITDLFETHSTVILSGGSMLYVDAVCNGIDFQPDVDPAIRKQLTHEFEETGLKPAARKFRHFCIELKFIS